jgi:hypothetical protein
MRMTKSAGSKTCPLAKSNTAIDPRSLRLHIPLNGGSAHSNVTRYCAAYGRTTATRGVGCFIGFVARNSVRARRLWASLVFDGLAVVAVRAAPSNADHRLPLLAQPLDLGPSASRLSSSEVANETSAFAPARWR